MKLLYVWIRGIDGGCRLVGELATTELTAGGRFQSDFGYSREWSSDPSSFPLDPISLPLDQSAAQFRAEQFHPPLAIFDDALPDDWGRRLLTMALRSEGRQPSPTEMLLRMRGGGTGALVFTEQAIPPDTYRSVPTTALSALVAAATKFEAGTLSAEDEFRRLLDGSSRAGGARPKALVHDRTGEWVAKFPSRTRDGAHDVVGLEATCLQLAQRAGLTTPVSRLQAVGRRRVLLVRRFDVTECGGRVHMVSMRTLYGERPGVFATAYSELAQVLARSSLAPAEDVAMLYRYMVFNAAIGNVDDHLKNFWMTASSQGYRLAPAFDLVPDINGRGEHTLMFRHGFHCPDQEDLLAIGHSWQVADPTKILTDVHREVGEFAAVARDNGVRNTGSLRTIHNDIQRRLDLIGKASNPKTC